MGPSSGRPTFSVTTACESVDAGEWRPPLSAPVPGNGNNWRPSGWPQYQRHPPPGGQHWSPSSVKQQPPGVANSPPYRHRGCHACGWPGCHSDFHREGAVSPQTPPAASGCFLCGERRCHSSRHEGYETAYTSASCSSSTSFRHCFCQLLNWLRSSPRGTKTPPAAACPRTIKGVLCFHGNADRHKCFGCRPAYC